MTELIDDIYASTARFLDRELTRERRSKELGGSIDADFEENAVELGWYQLLLPESFDGLGVEPADLVPFFELMGRHLVPGFSRERMLLPGLVLSTLGDQLPESVLTTLLDTQTLATRIAHIDGDMVGNWRSTMGELSVIDGRLNGHVEAVEYGADATHLLVFTGTADTAQVLLIPSSAGLVTSAGGLVTVTPQVSNDPGSRRARVVVDGLPVLPEHVIASGEAADKLMSGARSWLRLMIAAELCGAATQTAKTAVEYVKTRHQFGQPLAAFQAVKHLAADNVQRLHLATQLCRATAVSARGDGEQDFSVAAAMAKSLAARNSRAVSEDCLQMLGGIGFTEEHDFHWYYKRILALHWMYGGPDELASAVARKKIEQARGRADHAV